LFNNKSKKTATKMTIFGAAAFVPRPGRRSAVWEIVERKIPKKPAIRHFLGGKGLDAARKKRYDSKW
jgi:hypothetical protein